MTERRYTHDRGTHNQRAARRVVPVIVERFRPKRVIDVGCGLGTWMRVFAELGCEARGLEGEVIPAAMLDVPPDWVQVVDLEAGRAGLDKFDLALCLEVAEHLSPEGGDRLIDLLTSAADVVVFGAAVPGQGGDHHVNEQWPEYWRSRFHARGFSFEDELRELFWDDEDVDWWYRQNMFLARRGGGTSGTARALVHPGLLKKKVAIEDNFYRGRIPLKTGFIIFARSLLHAAKRRLRL